MSVSENLIDFDIIETQKENIQPLPSGRSAKALASTFAPSLRPSGDTPNDTRNLNLAIREEYEIEVKSAQDSDDPLDIYDRYIKWTLATYPSAQATPDSQLRSLLERATKAFHSVAHYKNDPRYLRIWLHYIRFFSDAPRETFAYLSRHGIGEGLGLFYEEFASWLEGAGRWRQAEEVYKLGIEREARPAERLVRKFTEFQTRFQARVINGDEPSSPALPTVRPALATKVDPFANPTSSSTDQQATRPYNMTASSSSRNGRQKITIFSDSDGSGQREGACSRDGPRGWDTIGTVAERRKENMVEAKPWAGETLKTAKRSAGVQKMAVFKDESKMNERDSKSACSQSHASHQQVSRPNRTERTFVDFKSVYPGDTDSSEEMSFEEQRANVRGWLNKDWNPVHVKTVPESSLPSNPRITVQQRSLATPETDDSSPRQSLSYRAGNGPTETTLAVNIDGDGHSTRQRKIKVKEVKSETQTIKTNLESPTGPKLRRKHSAEPTMTLHTKAATDDILDIFNQPLRNFDPMAGPIESEAETDGDDDDEYLSAGESTGTGRISGTSEFGDTDTNLETATTHVESAPESVSPWSDFTASKHVPRYKDQEADADETFEDFIKVELPPATEESRGSSPHTGNINCPSADVEASACHVSEALPEKFIPVPPDDYEPPAKYRRDSAVAAQNRLPFMTPIIERTETSAAAFVTQTDIDDFALKTPSRNHAGACKTPMVDGEPLSSPFQEIINDSKPVRAPRAQPLKDAAPLEGVGKGTIIQDVQCNPIDDTIRQSLLQNLKWPLSSRPRFHDHREVKYNRSSEIRKFIRSLSRSKSSEKTTAAISLPPVLRFPDEISTPYTIRRELGKGAYAPVYLAEQSLMSDPSEVEGLVAIKSEDPPSAWEFYIMTTLHERLSSNSRAKAALLQPFSMHLFSDEGYLVEEYLDQGTLLDLVNLAKSDPVSGQTTLDENVAMFFAVELLRIVEAMHQVGILHGDLKADNCLVRLDSVRSGEVDWSTQYQANGSNGWSSKGMTLIDFGRSIDMTQFRSNVQFIADWKTGKQDCIEMRELRPWTYQVDYFGIAGVVHSLLFGKYIEDTIAEDKDNGPQLGGLAARKRYRIKENLKRYWQTHLWSRLFDLALNPLIYAIDEEGGTMPCIKGLKGLRVDMESWLMDEGGKRNGGLKNSLIRLESRIREKKVR